MDFFDTRANLDVSNQLGASDTQKILQELIGGAQRPRYVRIYTHTVLNRERSDAMGHRCYDEVPFILAKFSANDDGVSRRLTEQDKIDYRGAWEDFQSRQSSGDSPSIDLLPAATPALSRELHDLGLGKIDGLLAYEGELPLHLRPVLKQARAWAKLNEGDGDEQDSGRVRIGGDRQHNEGAEAKAG